MKHPDRLIGLILVDATSRHYDVLNHLKTPDYLKANSTAALIKQWQSWYEMDVKTYKSKLQGFTGHSHLPKDWQQGMVDCFENQEIFKTIHDEMASFSTSASQVDHLWRTLKLPVSIISRDPKTTIEESVQQGMLKEELLMQEEAWQDLQGELKSISSQSHMVQARGCNHGIPIEGPHFIRDAVYKMLAIK